MRQQRHVRACACRREEQHRAWERDNRALRREAQEQREDFHDVHEALKIDLKATALRAELAESSLAAARQELQRTQAAAQVQTSCTSLHMSSAPSSGDAYFQGEAAQLLRMRRQALHAKPDHNQEMPQSSECCHRQRRSAAAVRRAGAQSAMHRR
jgi:hypothetical protein